MEAEYRYCKQFAFYIHSGLVGSPGDNRESNSSVEKKRFRLDRVDV